MTDKGRKRRWPFFDPFGDDDDLDREFERIREMMGRMMEGYRSGDAGEGEPIVYGFTYRKGADGVPYFEEFGNARRFQSPLPGEAGDSERPAGQPDRIEGRREPLTDVIFDGGEIAVTVEIPGVDKSNIKLDVLEDQLVIDVDDPARKYFKEVALPAKVVTGEVRATYNNGVLDVVLKVDEKKRNAKRVQVE